MQEDELEVVEEAAPVVATTPPETLWDANWPDWGGQKGDSG